MTDREHPEQEQHKKPYTSPTLTRYGTVEELTQGTTISQLSEVGITKF